MLDSPLLRGACCALLLSMPLAALAIPEGPDFPSPAWAQREAANYLKTAEGPQEQAANPAFMARWSEQMLANQQSWNARWINDPSWLGYPSGNTTQTPLCTVWFLQCAGDPFRYPDTDPFYVNEAQVIPFVIYDDGCARLSGRVWAPKGSKPGDQLPAVIIENGSIEAPETLYWWAAQALVRAGYIVATFDPRGQGRSDQQTPTGGQGTNINSAVFWTGLVNVIDFFRATPVMPYPHNQTCARHLSDHGARFQPVLRSNRPQSPGHRRPLAGRNRGLGGAGLWRGRRRSVAGKT